MLLLVEVTPVNTGIIQVYGPTPVTEDRDIDILESCAKQSIKSKSKHLDYNSNQPTSVKEKHLIGN